MSIETEIAGLTQATNNLLGTVNIRKAILDQKVDAATAQASNAATSATAAANSATASASSAASALNIYGNTSAMNTAVTNASTSATNAATSATNAANSASLAAAITGAGSGAFGPTPISTSSTLTLNGGTANGVLYLDGSKAATSGSALVFDGTNLGLGVTPSAWVGDKALQVNWGSISSGYEYSVNVSSAAYRDSATWKYLVSSQSPARYEQIGGAHKWLTAPSGTAGNPISFTQAMTLESSGRLLVGAPSAAGSETLRVYNGANSRINIDTATNGLIVGADGSGPFFDTTGSNRLAFFIAGTERARIDSSGNLLVGKTSSSGGVAGVENHPYGLVISTRDGGFSAYFNRLTSDGDLVSFNRSNTQVGSVSVTTSATAYNTSSDYRLKNTIAPMTGALAKVAALKPVTYKWNADGSDGEGFIAHELAEVCPQAVTGEKDAADADGNPVYQGIDTSFLVATLTAAIQEQQAIITELRSRIEALESI